MASAHRAINEMGEYVRELEAECERLRRACGDYSATIQNFDRKLTEVTSERDRAIKDLRDIEYMPRRGPLMRPVTQRNTARAHDAEGRPLCFVCGERQSQHPGGIECAGEGPMPDGMSRFGEHFATVTAEVHSGPFGEMRAVTPLTPEDLRAGARRCERDAEFRRKLAADMEEQGRHAISAAEAVALTRDQS